MPPTTPGPPGTDDHTRHGFYDLGEYFTADEVHALIVAAAELYDTAGDPHDVLSDTQKELATRALGLFNAS